MCPWHAVGKALGFPPTGSGAPLACEQSGQIRQDCSKASGVSLACGEGRAKGRRRFLSRACPCRVWGTPNPYNPDEAEQGKSLPCVRGSNPVQIRTGRPVSSLPRVRGPNGEDSVSAMKRGPFARERGPRLSFNLLEGHAVQASCILDRFHVEKDLPAAGSGRSLRRHKHNASVLSNAGAGVP